MMSARESSNVHAQKSTHVKCSLEITSSEERDSLLEREQDAACFLLRDSDLAQNMTLLFVTLQNGACELRHVLSCGEARLRLKSPLGLAIRAHIHSSCDSIWRWDVKEASAKLAVDDFDDSVVLSGNVVEQDRIARAVIGGTLSSG